MTSADRSRTHDLAPGTSDDLSFLADPEALADWRLVLAYEATAGAGVLKALPGRLDELAATLRLEPGPLRAALGQLVAWEIVEEHDGHYRSGPRAPGPLQDAMMLRHAAVIRRWATLLGARLRDHRSADPVPPPALDPATGLDLLAHHQRDQIGPVLDLCRARFPDAVRVLDLGGGVGAHAVEMARRGLRPTLQDLPQVVRIADQRGVAETGVDLFPGDLTEVLPPGPFDLVLCSAVTNLFDAATNRDLLTRVRPLLSPGGGIAVVSYLRDRHPIAAAFALQMLIWTDGGDAHGEDDYRDWLGHAGFEPPEVHDLGDPPQTVLLAGAPDPTVTDRPTTP